MRIAAAMLAMALMAGAAAAQDEECAPGVAEAATPPMPGEATAPGNAATGWSGGLGGSQTGTNPQGAVSESTTWQPPTARGLDLMGAAAPAC
jgi:opacity protein-like surface antigen